LKSHTILKVFAVADIPKGSYHITRVIKETNALPKNRSFPLLIVRRDLKLQDTWASALSVTSRAIYAHHTVLNKRASTDIQVLVYV
jgi:hypothetical protein